MFDIVNTNDRNVFFCISLEHLVFLWSLMTYWMFFQSVEVLCFSSLLNSFVVVDLWSCYKTGITGVLCSKFCRKVVFTDHNDEVLKVTSVWIKIFSENNSPLVERNQVLFSDTEEKHRASWTFKPLSWWEREKSTLLLILNLLQCLFMCLAFLSTELEVAKLEWGNSDHLGEILQKHSDGFDLILGADIYILILCLVWFWFWFS